MSASGPAFAGERVLVVGYGASGRAATRVLLDEGAEVRVSEARTAEELGGAGEVVEAGAAQEVLAGGHRPEHLDGVTLVVVSPGVPEHEAVIGWALERGLPIWSELEVGARLCRVPYVAVTGTNGKSTTVEMVAAMMRAAGLSARACGNIGYPFSLAARDPADALAVEASSFQLRFHQSLHPRISALLNLAPDHLDWHGSFEAYAAAKARVFLRQSSDLGDVHVGNRDDSVAAAISRSAPCAHRWFGSGSPAPGDAAVIDASVVARTLDGEALELGTPASPVRSFVLDAAAAAATALAFGLPAEAVRGVIETFSPLPHRGTLVAEVDSVRFIDDSKATNPHAALAALEGLKDVVLIAGGLDRGVDLSPLRAAASSVSGVVAMGESAPGVARAFDGLVPVRRAATIEDAVAEAFDAARSGGIVLLAPACASQDMFRDYQERGDRFAAAVRALAEREGPSADPPASAKAGGAQHGP